MLSFSSVIRFKVSGDLPLVHLRISDQKLKSVFELIDSIPLLEQPSVASLTVKVNPLSLMILCAWGGIRQRQCK